MTSPPVLAGPVAIGATLTCPATGFTGDVPLTLSYAWLRGGAPIAGEAPSPFNQVHRRCARLLDADHDGKGHLSISLSCPKSTPGGTCAVTLSVYAATGSLRTSVARVKKKPHPAALLAHGATSIAAGSKVTTKLTLKPAGWSKARDAPHSRNSR